ncbi:ABC transporter ATP-binding protein [Pedobacter sp. SD-b]|uniref:ABC transporter ATP-binding protein n=1 Tax=Pedobacter segetis TaxID=2793069 RepID=A0ABS1BH35_9SPHI|nr:ABC transporter ATP-binding protein [Pedobacter segetis]MBK0382189.1 ABC transporter ATP-binding protein [Pedobacter segetis]
MIELKNISKSFDKTNAVKNISFSVLKDETLVLLGTSGCGKTTTLKMINRLIKADSGDIFINGENIKKINEEKLRLGIGYVLQNHGLLPHYTIEQNIAIVPNLLRWGKDKTDSRMEEMLHKLHLPLNLKDKYPNQLSGGQQQRVGLARALMAKPPILLMDEPFGALDPITKESIKKEFLTLDELQNKAIVMVTHDIQEAFELGDRICLMSNGEMIQIGKPTELLEKPRNGLVKDFFRGQKLQLSLKAIEVKNLSPFLEPSADRYDDAISIDHQSVWDILEILAEKPFCRLEINGELKKATNGSLMEAIEKFKATKNGTTE